MTTRKTGTYETSVVGGESVQAFVPYPLPPKAPPLKLEAALTERLRHAEQALLRLELTGEMVPLIDWFIYAFVRKEAVLSSQIEGTQATLLDLLSYEAKDPLDTTPPDADVEEVCNYLDALTLSRTQLNSPTGLPLSMRLLHQAHKALLTGVRGEQKMPGEVRRSQNWIGGSRPGNARYVPPPSHLLSGLLSDFEKYIHAKDALPPLMRAGLLHVQFESIHPYLDGNGRIGRLLVTLLLEHWKLLTRPLLYLSLFFKRRREEYYQRLNAVRTEGDWESWLDFFLEGVATIAQEAANTARNLFTLVSTDRERLLSQEGLNVVAVQLFERLPSQPILTMAWVVKALGTSKPTASRAIKILEAAKILEEVTGKKRDRSYMYQAYLDQLRIGTELKE